MKLLLLLFVFTAVCSAANATPRVLWSANVSATEFGFWGAPAVSADGGRVFAGSANGALSALDGNNGHLRWTFATPDVINAGPILSQDEALVFVGSNNACVYALDAATGALVWRVDLGAPIELPPTLAGDGTLLVEGNDGRLAAYSPATGAVVWQNHVARGWVSDLFVIPALQLVFAGSSDFVLYAFDTRTGKTVWSYTMPHYYGVKGFAAGPDNTLYVSGDHLYAFAGGSGSLLWRYTWSAVSVLNAVAYAAPDTLVLGVEYPNQTRGVTGFDIAKQTPVWGFVADGPIQSTPLVVASTGTAYAGSIPGTLYAFAATTGARLWALVVGSLAVATPAVGANGTIIVATLSTVVCVG